MLSVRLCWGEEQREISWRVLSQSRGPSLDVVLAKLCSWGLFAHFCPSEDLLNPKGSKYPPLPAQKKGICGAKMIHVANWAQSPFVLLQKYSEVARMPFRSRVSLCRLENKVKPTPTWVFLCQLKGGLDVFLSPHPHRQKRWLKKCVIKKENNVWVTWTIFAPFS